MPPSPNIRRAGAEDEPAIYALLCTLEEETLARGGFQHIYAQALQSSSCHFLVAENEGRILAFLHLQFRAMLHHAALVCEIVEFIVCEEARGMGLGAVLLREAEALSEAAGCVQIELVSNRRRLRAHHFYEKNGFAKSHFGFTKPLAPKIL